MSPSLVASSAAAAASGADGGNSVSGEKPSPSTSGADPPGEVTIREVWSDNLDSEFVTIRAIIDEYPIVAMDTEFPGTVVSVLASDATSWPENNYQNLATNVNLLRLLQLGLAFASRTGVLYPRVWQFNFSGFNREVDMHVADSLKLLEKAGVNFDDMRVRGIDVTKFAELLMSSGAVLNDEVSWVTFHGGYDFGYLIRALTGATLPESYSEFFKLLQVFFPHSYDVKNLIRYCRVNLHGGLDAVATTLGMGRVGMSHQAGSDSLITLQCYLAIVDRFLSGNLEKYDGVLYGLGDEHNKPVK